MAATTSDLGVFVEITDEFILGLDVYRSMMHLWIWSTLVHPPV
jgi:hypothetical protein